MSRPLLEWGAAMRALPGETQSGDRHIVKQFPDGALLAVVDGLGHGGEAAAAAAAAVGILDRHAREPVIALVERCHEHLRGTRGVVMSLAWLEARASTLTWLGVGNVEGILHRAGPHVSPARESLLLRGGVVGGQLPPLLASIVPVMRGDTLILATDGIRSEFGQVAAAGQSPQGLADRILRRHGKESDDALVLVALYLGSES